MALWIGSPTPYKLAILALGRSQDYQKFKVIHSLSNSKGQPYRSINISLIFSFVELDLANGLKAGAVRETILQIWGFEERGWMLFRPN